MSVCANQSCRANLGNWTINQSNCHGHQYHVALLSIADSEFSQKVLPYCRACQLDGSFARAMCDHNRLEKKMTSEEKIKQTADEIKQLQEKLDEAKSRYPLLVSECLLGKVGEFDTFCSKAVEVKPQLKEKVDAMKKDLQNEVSTLAFKQMKESTWRILKEMKKLQDEDKQGVENGEKLIEELKETHKKNKIHNMQEVAESIGPTKRKISSYLQSIDTLKKVAEWGEKFVGLEEPQDEVLPAVDPPEQ